MPKVGGSSPPPATTTLIYNYMKKYIGKKEVEAMPMTLGDFVARTGREPYKNHEEHDPEEDGYLVKYKDGYESWSPKEVFEEAYRCSETFLNRMEVELEELQEKQDKLNKFFDTETFKSLSDKEKNLLHAQFGAMVSYSSILIERIRFEKSGMDCEECEK